MKKHLWKGLAGLSAVAAALAARKVAEAVWTRAAGSEVPSQRAEDDATWPQALGWAMLAGVLAGVARVVARRGAAAAWKQATGEPAPAS